MIQPRDPPEKSSPGDGEAETSLWEMLGRGVGKTLRAAKEVSTTIGHEAVRFADRQEGEEKLDERYRVLGRVVAEQILEWKSDAISARDPAIARTVEEIRELRQALDARDVPTSPEPETAPESGES